MARKPITRSEVSDELKGTRDKILFLIQDIETSPTCFDERLIESLENMANDLLTESQKLS